jgi:hypothetical protein
MTQKLKVLAVGEEDLPPLTDEEKHEIEAFCKKFFARRPFMFLWCQGSDTGTFTNIIERAARMELLGDVLMSMALGAGSPADPSKKH